jgi:Protein of unknown function (DUF3025)
MPVPMPAATRHMQAGTIVLPGIDWSRPWFAPYRELGSGVQASLERGLGVAQALNLRRSSSSPQFVPPSALGGEAYESFIARTGCVPTRDNLHDLFNGLVWLRFPALKRRLNVLHAGEIARHGVSARRGAARDALTLFDENGALLRAPPALTVPLQGRDWRALFVSSHGLWCEAQLVIVGHALLEKLVQPRKTITAHVWLAPAPWCGDPDDAVPGIEPCVRAFAPLPVLGVPGWWRANETRDFYDDVAVFRPAENLRSTGTVLPYRS